jgi:hypothetical protein
MNRFEWIECAMVGQAFLIWLLLPPSAAGGTGTPYPLAKIDKESKVHVTYWSQVKATTMLGTTVAILAIDFPSIFARNHAKSEEYGISVMDSGVALVTILSGISSRKARPWNKPKPLGQELVETVKLSLVPIIFGFARFLMLS